MRELIEWMKTHPNALYSWVGCVLGVLWALISMVGAGLGIAAALVFALLFPIAMAGMAIIAVLVILNRAAKEFKQNP